MKINKRIIKGILVISSLLLLICGLGACSNKSQSSSATNKRIVINYWDALLGPYQKLAQQMVADFNKSQSKYKVVMNNQGNYADLEQKIMAAAKSKQLPVIAQAPYTTVPNYVKNGLLEPLNSYMLHGDQRLTSADLNDIYPVFLQNAKYHDNYYSIPFCESLSVLYYNKDLMAKYGIKQPTSWEELQQDKDKITDSNVKLVVFDQSFDKMYESLAKAAGTSIVDPQSLSVKITSQPSMDAMNFIMNMIKNGSAETSGADPYGNKIFAAQKAVFYADTCSDIMYVKQQAPANMNWGTMVLPSFHNKKATMIEGSNLVMFKSATPQQKAGAWAFMKFVLSKKESTKWAQETGYMPLRKSSVNSSSYQAFLHNDPVHQAEVDSLPYAFNTTIFPGYSQFHLDEVTAIQNMVDNKQSVNDAMNQFQKEAQTIIANNR